MKQKITKSKKKEIKISKGLEHTMNPYIGWQISTEHYFIRQNEIKVCLYTQHSTQRNIECKKQKRQLKIANRRTNAGAKMNQFQCVHE